MSKRNNALPELCEIPSVDDIIDHFKGSMVKGPYTLYINIIRETLDIIRHEIRKGTISENIQKCYLNS